MVHGCMVTGVHGARMQGCMVLGCRVYIYMGARNHGNTEPWVHGNTEPWGHGTLEHGIRAKGGGMGNF